MASTVQSPLVYTGVGVRLGRDVVELPGLVKDKDKIGDKIGDEDEIENKDVDAE